jgi:hypothetical protein
MRRWVEIRVVERFQWYLTRAANLLDPLVGQQLSTFFKDALHPISEEFLHRTFIRDSRGHHNLQWLARNALE